MLSGHQQSQRRFKICQDFNREALPHHYYGHWPETINPIQLKIPDHSQSVVTSLTNANTGCQLNIKYSLTQLMSWEHFLTSDLCFDYPHNAQISNFPVFPNCFIHPHYLFHIQLTMNPQLLLIYPIYPNWILSHNYLKFHLKTLIILPECSKSIRYHLHVLQVYISSIYFVPPIFLVSHIANARISIRRLNK